MSLAQTSNSSIDFKIREEQTIETAKKRRKNIKPRPTLKFNLWTVLKSSIGKDLTRIPVPVHFNEPLSALQRITEDLMYSEMLDKAADCGIRGECVMQLAYLAAFTVSTYSKSLMRHTKPFNSLLGETYELDRVEEEQWGWRCISEQVSHHPPTLALHAESFKRGWQFQQEFTVGIKFRGKYLAVHPRGCLRVDFKDGAMVTWNRATTHLHNILMGKLWIDNCGLVKIVNHTNGYSCELEYVPYSLNAEKNRIVKGVIKGANGEEEYFLSGYWDSYLKGSSSNDQTVNGELLWRAMPPRKDAHAIHHFSDFAVELNEPEDGVAPTDSRLRPDQRLMEEGHWEEADKIKRKLEARQRCKRKETKEPLWFKKVWDSCYRGNCYVTNRKYWEMKKKQDWSICPNIFTY
ncbi:hypothetical protein Ciccas_012892 [Cichlidogyrus casuarinus]|uniref:Oxysterol-binding protein n=1 Tax=Cichlidogyrus casuarinus TaxID=1844966 RepID=A0ABD2PM14_9PLAT